MVPGKWAATRWSKVEGVLQDTKREEDEVENIQMEWKEKVVDE